MPYNSKYKSRAYEKEWRRREYVKEKRKQYLKKTEKQRKDWAANYYIKNKDKINDRVKEYRALHPEKIIKWKESRRSKERIRSIKDRKKLKPFYINSLIRAEGSKKSIVQKKKEIVVYRIRKVLKNIP